MSTLIFNIPFYIDQEKNLKSIKILPIILATDVLEIAIPMFLSSVSDIALLFIYVDHCNYALIPTSILKVRWVISRELFAFTKRQRRK